MSRAKPRTELQALHARAVGEKRHADERPARFEKLVTAEIERMRREVPGLISQKNGVYFFDCACGDRFGFRPSLPVLFLGDYNKSSTCTCCTGIRQRIWACYEELQR